MGPYAVPPPPRWGVGLDAAGPWAPPPLLGGPFAAPSGGCTDPESRPRVECGASRKPCGVVRAQRSLQERAVLKRAGARAAAIKAAASAPPPDPRGVSGLTRVPMPHTHRCGKCGITGTCSYTAAKVGFLSAEGPMRVGMSGHECPAVDKYVSFRAGADMILQDGARGAHDMQRARRARARRSSLRCLCLIYLVNRAPPAAALCAASAPVRAPVPLVPVVSSPDGGGGRNRPWQRGGIAVPQRAHCTCLPAAPGTWPCVGARGATGKASATAAAAAAAGRRAAKRQTWRRTSTP